MAVGRTEERLDGAVRGVGLVLERERGERDRLLELLAEGAREVRHLGVAGDPARSPFPHLAGAEGGLASVGKRLFEQHQIHAFKVASCL